MDLFRRIALILLIGFGTLAFLAIWVGPERINPWLTDFLRLEPPPPLPPSPVHEARDVSGRVIDAVSEADVRGLMDRLTRHRSRVPGYPGHNDAARFVLREFERLGLQDVKREPFDVTSPVDKGGRLTLTKRGVSFPIHAIWPNLVKTSTLPPDGVRTRLIYGGSGAWEKFNGHDMEGAAILMEFNSWNRWVNAASLGAGQIIFIEPDSTSHGEGEQKFLITPNGTERFWIDKRAGRALRQLLAEQGEVEVVLHARMDWEKTVAHNILGTVPGTDPELKDEIVVINAYYDAMSVVPALAPGAEMASGIVALLELADYFQRYPPARTVLFLATSAHHLGFRGISDFLRRHARKQADFAALMTDPIDIQLFISLDLSSRTDEIGLWNSTESHYYKRFFTPIGKSFVRFSRAISEAFDLDPDRALIDGVNPPPGLTWTIYNPGKVVKTEGLIVMEAGTPALSLVTVNDARLRVDTPLDRPEFVDFENLTGQIRLLSGVIDLALNDPGFITEHKLRPEDRVRWLKGYARTFPRRSIVPDRPKPGAIAAVRTGTARQYLSPKSDKGVRQTRYDLADEKGEFTIPGIIGKKATVSVYVLDPSTGEITYAPDRGGQAEIYEAEIDVDWWMTQHISVLFPCIATDFYDIVDPRYLTKLSEVSVYGPDNAAPQAYGYDIGVSTSEEQRQVESMPVGTLFTRPGEKVKIAIRSWALGLRFLLLNAMGVASEEEARGGGFVTLSPGAFSHTAYKAARDMWMLNETRIRELKRFAIQNHRLNVLHGQAADHLAQAESALAQRRWDRFMKHSRAALGIESRAYPDVKATQNGVIRGIIFFMALVIPCAFFAERLIFTASDIRWQLAAFGGIFAVIWAFLYVVHPAFELSNPFVVLLAFIILALAAFVISLIFSRFGENMKRLRTADVLLHETDVGRISASLAAFQLGIANMKRRRLRTWLTFLTLLLLTFTVLSFTSIKSSLHFHKLERDTEGAYPGLLIRSLAWTQLEEVAYNYVKTHFQEIGVVAPRNWYRNVDRQLIPLDSEGKPAFALGALGMGPEEAEVTGIDRFLKAGRWFRPEERACILPEKLADYFGIASADVGQRQVRLFGELLTVVGIIDADKLRHFEDLDGEILTPPDFVETGIIARRREGMQEHRERQGFNQPAPDVFAFQHLDPDDVLILPYDFLRAIGNPLQTVAVRFRAGVDVEAQVKALLSRLALVLFAGLPDADGRVNVSVYSSFGDTSFRGLGSLFIPVLIAALIVLNTMMGSVYERFREIGIYSAVGLAPLHIAFLFIAESCVYAVFGTVGGYLLGQGVAKVVLWQGWLSGVTLNYSAMSAVYAAALVMAVVILSTLYPARKASSMAVPDVTRRWTLPDPEGDRWSFEFPFTVGGQEVFGLTTFLVDYFESHRGESTGRFFCEGAGLEARATERGEGCTIETTIWPAPYDLGVSQQVRCEVSPAGEFDIYTLALQIDRISGDVTSWQRVNRGFMSALRKQFLIWRTLSPEDRASYIRRGREIQIDHGPQTA